MAHSDEPRSAADLLKAYADGELEGTEKLAAMRRAAADPSATRAVEQELQLRNAVRRLVAAEPPPPPELVKAIEAMAFQMPTPMESGPRGDVANLRSGTAWQRLAAVAAAILLLLGGILIGRLTPMRPPVVQDLGNQPQAQIIPASYVDSATKVHVGCSRREKHHEHEGWPQAMAVIEGPITQYAHNNNQPYPDLSSIGYHYLGCGPCGRPTQQRVHLLYRNTAGTDTLSLFVEPFTNQVNLGVNQCHCLRSNIHPALVWRTANLVFFLVGNDLDTVEKAGALIGVPKPI